MTKVYPNANANAKASSVISAEVPKSLPDHGSSSVVLTVWKKSLLFNCNDFTVFDDQGNLVFRVDNYNAGTKGEIVLMDASGSSLLTIRRKWLSLWDSWLVFNGETAVHPLFSVKKNVNLLNSKSLAQVTSLNDHGKSVSVSPKEKVVYEIEGTYAQRCCAVYDDKLGRVAEIKRKEAVRGVAFGIDVFRLIVQPGELISPRPWPLLSFLTRCSDLLPLLPSDFPLVQYKKPLKQRFTFPPLEVCFSGIPTALRI